MVRVALTLAAALVLLAACGDEAADPEEAAVSATPDATAPARVPEAAAPSATPDVEGDAGAPEPVAAAALAVLAESVGAAETGVSLDSATPEQWSDASLGCPQEGFGYAQVVTLGYRLLFSYEGAVYAVHTNVDGSHAVVCEDTEGPQADTPFVAPETEVSSGAPEPVAAAALAVLAESVGAAGTAFSPGSAKAEQWSDASLGCPQEGFAYAQVVTLGYRLLFSYEGAVYAVHTNVDGSHAVVCEDGAG
ncbi:MAG: hypothetical protein OXC99_10795 [Chloroflexi bacterium]|nr:hypothetical protein [Chloroflexota bacterium]